MQRSTRIRTAAALAGSAALAIATTTAASAAPGAGPGGQNVAATVSVQTGLTVTGISGAVDFGSATVGQTVTKAGAETYTISTNSPGGYTVALSSSQTDWQRTGFTGQFTGLGNNALSVKNSAGSIVTATGGANNPVTLETGPAGATNINEDRNLTVPGAYTGSGDITR